MGGLSKKSTLLTKLSSDTNQLRLDAGTLFFDNKLAKQPQRLPQAKVTAEAIVDIYNYLSYDAIAVASQDMAAGIDTLQTLAKKASFPFISANIVNQDNERLFSELTLIDRGDIRIAVIALTGSAELPQTCVDQVRILAWQDVLPKAVENARQKSDFIVLLSNLTALENRQIAQEFDTIHLIVQSGVSTHNMRPEIINNTVITQTGHDGKYLGQLTVNWSAAKKWQTGDSTLLALRKEYDRLGWLISRVRKKGGPEKVYQNNKEAQKTFATKLKRYQELEEEIRQRAAGNENKVELATYTNHFHSLPPSVADDKEVSKILQQSRVQANKLRRPKSLSHRFATYAGSKACQECHTDIYQAWQQTPHAEAYATLVEKDQNNNLNCVFCHVTGLDEANSYLAAALPGRLREVGCESCHGPGKNHVTAPTSHPLTAQPAAALCLGCHTKERDDTFDYQTDSKHLHS